MLNIELVNEYVNKIYRQLGININVMNTKGIIVASGDITRVGDFHSVAFELVKSRNFISIVDDHSSENIGVQNGVNLLIIDNLEPIGVVGVTGSPSEVLEIAKMSKITIESYCLQINSVNKEQVGSTEIRKLKDALLFEQPINPTRIFQLSTRLGIRDNINRAALIIHSTGENSNEAISLIYDSLISDVSNAQDIILPTDQQHIVILKAFKNFEPAIFRTKIHEFYSSLADLIYEKYNFSESINLKLYCNLPTNSLVHYRNSYRCLKWLESHVQFKSSPIHHIHDYLIDYLMSCIPDDRLSPLFECYHDIIENYLDKETFHLTAKALANSNMNPTEAAKELYVHKNTIFSRTKKFKEELDLQPLSNTNDAIKLLAIDSYFTNNK
ncbi:MAG: sugar diacid recognition domain-containing protein [Lachnospiraceae bacterium]